MATVPLPAITAPFGLSWIIKKKKNFELQYVERRINILYKMKVEVTSDCFIVPKQQLNCTAGANVTTLPTSPATWVQDSIAMECKTKNYT